LKLIEIGYLAGFLLGDGSASYNKANRSYEVTIDQIDKNKHLMVKLLEPIQQFSKPHFYKFKSPDGFKQRIRVNNKALSTKIKRKELSSVLPSIKLKT
jgi:hypothetical protein